MNTEHDWTVDDYAQHYAKVMHQPPNAWGQHISSMFGQSHHIMGAACRHFDTETVMRAFDKAMREYRGNDHA